MFFQRLFSKSGTYEAYKMFSASHFMLLIICAFFIVWALNKSLNMNKDAVLKTVRRCVAVLWILETAKIIFNLYIGNAHNPNSYIPLYFCSIPLYCGILSSYAKGKLRHWGDVFLIVGGITGGVGYMLSPCTTAGIYPVFHFITIQSYVLHSVMIYLGILFIITDYCPLKMKDIFYYSTIVICFSIAAYTINSVLGSNLMFVSETFPGTAIDIVYSFSPALFPVLITFLQAVPPFIVI